MLSYRSMCWTIARTRSRGRDVLAERGLAHPGRVGQFGVVVVAEDVVERLRHRAERVDVRMRVDERNGGESGGQVADEGVGRHGSISGRSDSGSFS